MMTDLELTTLIFLCEIGGTVDNGTALELCRTLREERRRNDALVAQLSDMSTAMLELSTRQQRVLEWLADVESRLQ